MGGHTRRRLIGGAILVCLLVAAFAPWPLPSRSLVALVGNQLETYYLRLTASDRVVVALLPVPRIKLTGVSVASRAGTEMVSDAQLRGELDVRALLVGRFALREVTLSGGRLAPATDALPGSAWRQAVETWFAAEPTGAPSLKRVSVRDVSIDLGQEPDGSDRQLRSVQLSLKKAGDGTLAGEFSGEFRGEAFDGSLRADRADHLVSGQPQRVDLRVRSRPLTLALTGLASLGEGAAFQGSISAETNSPGALLGWLGTDGVPDGHVPRIALSGAATIRDGEVSWPALRFELGTDVLDGAMSARLAGSRPTIRATLATDRLDLGWALHPVVAALGSADKLSSGPLALPASASVDLRLSSHETRIGALRLEDGAGSLLAENGRFDLSLLRARFAGGTARGRISSGTDEDRPELKAQIGLERIDLGSALSELGLPAAGTGTVTAQAAFEMPTDVAAPWTERLSGRLVGSAEKCGFTGIDLGEILRRAEPGPLNGGGWRTGRTRLDGATVQVVFANGRGEVAESSFRSEVLAGSLAGQLSLGTRSLNLRARVARAGESGGREIAVGLDGLWSEPRWKATVLAPPPATAQPDSPAR